MWHILTSFKQPELPSRRDYDMTEFKPAVS